MGIGGSLAGGQVISKSIPVTCGIIRSHRITSKAPSRLEDPRGLFAFRHDLDIVLASEPSLQGHSEDGLHHR